MKLKIDGITKSYGKNLALDNFSAEFDSGIYALLGTNGSGKSTFMNILTDNLKADRGKIEYSEDGVKWENVLDMDERFRAKLGFMPQYPGLYPNITVERFMWYMASLKGMSKADAERQIPVVLEAVELNEIPKLKIGALSGGMKQRLTLAQAVLGDPEILMLDEPTAGLDPKQRISLRNYISKIAQGKIVIIATHVVSDIEFIANEVIMLKKGVIVSRGTPEELIETIRGKVWICQCADGELGEMQNNFRVTNISRAETSGEIMMRILSESPPSDRSKSTAPTLEDYYLWISGERNIG